METASSPDWGSTDQARPRRVEIRASPPGRRVVVQAVRAGRRRAPMHGLVDLDVTEARRLLTAMTPSPSFTAYIVGCVGRAAAAYPEVHGYRDWRGRLVVHSFVDVATLVELNTPTGPFPMAHLVRDADLRTVSDISSEIRRVKAEPNSSRSGQLLTRLGPTLGKIPTAAGLFYRLMERSVTVRQMAGTVSVTAVGMFGGGGGYGVGFPTVLTLGILVGGISQKPRAVNGQIEVREVLDLTVTVDHKIVDGAPAARFVSELRNQIETAQVLSLNT